MKSVLKAVSLIAVLFALGVTLAPAASAQCAMPYPGGVRPSGCPPAGFFFDLATVITGPMSPTEQQITTSFTANNSSEYVSFAFREVPNYFAFDDASITNSTTGSTTNLLADPGFESATDGQNCNDQGQNNLGCPAGWGTWITPEDTSAIGQVATNGNPYGCPSDVATHGGTNFWCDGSVQGYDGIYQQLTGLTVGDTYSVSFWIGHDDGAALVGAAGGYTIDMLAYAGQNLPLGTVALNTTPEPGTLVLFGSGMLSLAGLLRRKLSK